MQNSNSKSPVQPTAKPAQSWTDQKSRMDHMLAKLKTEIKEVQVLDKHLTRQFIVLGGQINELKHQQDEAEAAEFNRENSEGPVPETAHFEGDF